MNNARTSSKLVKEDRSAALTSEKRMPLYSGKPWCLAPPIRHYRWRERQNR